MELEGVVVVGTRGGTQAVPDVLKGEGLAAEKRRHGRSGIEEAEVFARGAGAVGLPEAAAFERGDAGPVEAVDSVTEALAGGVLFGFAHPVEDALVGLLDVALGGSSCMRTRWRRTPRKAQTSSSAQARLPRTHSMTGPIHGEREPKAATWLSRRSSQR